MTTYPFLQGGGEMGRLTRNYNWSQSPLGMPGEWPHSLGTTVSNILRSRFPMFLWWGAEMIQFYNDAYRLSLGVNGKHPSALGAKGADTWEDTWAIISPLLQQVETTGEPTWMENQLVPIFRNGRLEDAYWTYSYSCVLDDDGNHGGILVTCIETTEAVLAHKKIEKSQQQLLTLFEESPVAIAKISKDDDLHFQFANSFYGVLVGRDPSEIIGKPLLEALPEIKGQGFDDLLRKVLQTGEPCTANEVAVNVKRSGKIETIYVDFVYQPQRVNDGSIDGVLAVITDVTKQVRARKKVEESKEELSMAIEIAALGTFYIDLRTNTGRYSQRVQDWFGFTQNELSMDVIFSFVHPEDRSAVLQAIQDSTSSEERARHDVTYRIIHPTEETIRHMRSFGKTFFTKEGSPYLIIGMIQDVTEQLRYQQQLQESELELQKKVSQRTQELENLNKELKRSNANLEEFAHAASHDLKEPVRKIHFFTNQLKNQLGDRLKENEVRSFGRIENATERMGNLIDDLLLYSHVSERPHETEVVDLNEKVERVLEDLELDIEEKGACISIAKLPVVKGYRRQLQQLFQNLISNALKYSKKDGVPHIEITASEVAENNRRYHLVAVKDNGIGFETEYNDKIFQMFARLHGKSEYSGTGVGLSIVKKVVDNHHGMIKVKSEPGVGSTFEIYLPM